MKCAQHRQFQALTGLQAAAPGMRSLPASLRRKHRWAAATAAATAAAVAAVVVAMAAVVRSLPARQRRMAWRLPLSVAWRWPCRTMLLRPSTSERAALSSRAWCESRRQQQEQVPACKTGPLFGSRVPACNHLDVAKPFGARMAKAWRSVADSIKEDEQEFCISITGPRERGDFDAAAAQLGTLVSLHAQCAPTFSWALLCSRQLQPFCAMHHSDA